MKRSIITPQLPPQYHPLAQPRPFEPLVKPTLDADARYPFAHLIPIHMLPPLGHASSPLAPVAVPCTTSSLSSLSTPSMCFAPSSLSGLTTATTGRTTVTSTIPPTTASAVTSPTIGTNEPHSTISCP
ncbi:unnamed protein product [Protopolystoma xenopodis]|uniref:Uncharacterized protein n=1 Tax=Protopolystoma xenopodis TaxID=117903 RepID=A0A448XPE9_9PLAT|nr:unnamed protein product [Protopolystoma xenopodis]